MRLVYLNVGFREMLSSHLNLHNRKHLRWTWIDSSVNCGQRSQMCPMREQRRRASQMLSLRGVLTNSFVTFLSQASTPGNQSLLEREYECNALFRMFCTQLSHRCGSMPQSCIDLHWNAVHSSSKPTEVLPFSHVGFSASQHRQEYPFYSIPDSTRIRCCHQEHTSHLPIRPHQHVPPPQVRKSLDLTGHVLTARRMGPK